MKIRLLIVDDHPTLIEGLRELLSRYPEIDVVATSTQGSEAIELAIALEPDVILMDVRLPDMTGEVVAREIRQLDLPTQILAFSAYRDDQHVKGMLSAGAMGYLLKTEDLDTIAKSIMAVSRGEIRLSREVAEVVYSWGKGNSVASSDLTSREFEILRLIVRGETNLQISNTLGIALGTVKNHVVSIYNKIGVHSRVEAVLWGQSHGIK